MAHKINAIGCSQSALFVVMYHVAISVWWSVPVKYWCPMVWSLENINACMLHNTTTAISISIALDCDEGMVVGSLSPCALLIIIVISIAIAMMLVVAWRNSVTHWINAFDLMISVWRYTKERVVGFGLLEHVEQPANCLRLWPLHCALPLWLRPCSVDDLRDGIDGGLGDSEHIAIAPLYRQGVACNVTNVEDLHGLKGRTWSRRRLASLASGR